MDPRIVPVCRDYSTLRPLVDAKIASAAVSTGHYASPDALSVLFPGGRAKLGTPCGGQ